MSVEYETRENHDAHHLAQVVLRLGPGFTVERCLSRLKTIFNNIAFLKASIEPVWGGTAGPLVYRLDDSHCPLPFYDHDGSRTITIGDITNYPNTLQELLSGKSVDLSSDSLIRFDLDRGTECTTLAITWLYMFMDARGSKELIRLLADETGDTDGWDSENITSYEQQRVNGLPGFSRRISVAKEWSSRMKELSRPPTHSLARGRPTETKAVRYSIRTFSDRRTDRCYKYIRENLGHLQPMPFFLALSLRAHDEVFRGRDTVPPSYLVPVPVDLRRGTSFTPMFRTHLSFLWFKVPPTVVRDWSKLLDELKKQRLNQIQSGFFRKMAITMENFRYFPQQLHQFLMSFQSQDDPATFFFSYLGDFLDPVNNLFGGEILKGFHVPAVPTTPGSSMIWEKVQGQLSLTHVYQEGVVTAGERKKMLRTIRSDMRDIIS